MQPKERFYTVFFKSLTDVSFYRSHLLSKNFWYSLRYLAFLLLLVSVVLSVALTILLLRFIPLVPTIITETKSGLTVLYPKELIVTVLSGSVSTNVREPYAIDLPPKWDAWIRKNAKDELSMYQHLVVIDTQAPVSNYAKMKSVFLVTNDSIVTPPRSNANNEFANKGYQVAVIDPQTTLVLDRQMYDEGLTVIFGFLDELPNILRITVVCTIIVLPFVLTAGLLIGYLFSLLFFAFILWLINLGWGKNQSFGTIYRLSMHGMTLSILFSLLQLLAGFAIPFGFSAIFMVWMIFVLREFPSRSSIQQ